MHSDEHYMRLAIEAAARNPNAPFGAVLADSRDGRVVANGCNRTADGPIWHGEIDVIQRASSELTESDWQRMQLFTTAEPCCMCQGAILWAGIQRVIFGTSIETLKQLGWQQIDITALEVKRHARWADCRVTGGILETECNGLFAAANA